MGARGARSGRGGSGAVHEPPPPQPPPLAPGGLHLPQIQPLCPQIQALCPPQTQAVHPKIQALCSHPCRCPPSCTHRVPPPAPRCLFPSISGRSPQNCRRLWFFQPLPSLSPLGAVAPALPVLGAALPSSSLLARVPPAPSAVPLLPARAYRCSCTSRLLFTHHFSDSSLPHPCAGGSRSPQAIAGAVAGQEPSYVPTIAILWLNSNSLRAGPLLPVCLSLLPS